MLPVYILVKEHLSYKNVLHQKDYKLFKCKN